MFYPLYFIAKSFSIPFYQVSTREWNKEYEKLLAHAGFIVCASLLFEEILDEFSCAYVRFQRNNSRTIQSAVSACVFECIFSRFCDKKTYKFNSELSLWQ